MGTTTTSRRGLRFCLVLVTVVLTALGALAATDFPPGPYPTDDPVPTHDGIIVND